MIESKMITKSIENAQKRVEEDNFGVRKRLVEYDDVMNAQRRGVYGRRQNALKGERIGTDIANMVYEVATDLTGKRYEGGFSEFDDSIRKALAIEAPFTEEEYAKMNQAEATDAIAEAALQNLNRSKEKMEAHIEPYIKEFVEEKGAKGKIGVPVSDGRRVYNVQADIQKAYEDHGKSIGKAWEKTVLLSSIDKAWQEQLREMDELRKSVQNASYEQKDPLVIYKLEAYELWRNMLWDMNSKAVNTLMRGHLPLPTYEEKKAQEEKAAQEAEARNNARRASMSSTMDINSNARAYNPYAGYSTTRDAYPGQSAQRQAAMNAGRSQGAPKQPVKNEPKVGRNEPCPCGSGKKYKNCHGRGE